MKSLLLTLYIFLAVIISSCDLVESDNEPSGDWLIDKGQVFDGGPGKDGIPALSSPELLSVSSISYLTDNDLVVGIKIGDEVRAYPHPILDWHEIINDGIGTHKYAITYCPLTGSGIAWNRKIGDQETTFGVSGFLYNTNLIPYDRLTNSNWSQMLMTSVNGSLIGTTVESYPIIETTWLTWKNMFPDSKVVSKNTGHSRNYGAFPYGDYKINHDRLLFPVIHEDSRLPKKERIFGIILDDQTKAYRFSTFTNGTIAFNETLNNNQIVIIGNKSKNFLTGFDRKLSDGTILTFTSVQNELPILMTDNESNKWNIFGEAVDGPRKGEKLKPIQSYVAYWFAWAAFYPNTEIYSN